MSESNAEEIVAKTVSIPINLIIGLAHLLIAKGVICPQEMTSLLQHQVAVPRGADDDWITEILEEALRQFRYSPPSSESGH